MGEVLLSSAQPFIALLSEDDDNLKVHALKNLNVLVDRFWSEIASELPKIEVLFEDERFPDRNLAALVASKVLYHIEELDESLRYSLNAGPLFDINEESEYVQTLVSKCIDQFISLRTKLYEKRDRQDFKARTSSSEQEKALIMQRQLSDVPIDPRLTNIIEQLFEKCYKRGEYRQALGIAIESRRLDHIQKSIQESGSEQHQKEMLLYCYEIAHTSVKSSIFRSELFEIIADMSASFKAPDVLLMCHCWSQLSDHESIATYLDELAKKGGESILMAYQIAFDLTDQNQRFLNSIIEALPITEKQASSSSSTDSMDTSSDSKSSSSSSKTEVTYETALTNLKRILSRQTQTDLFLHFLHSHNKTDTLLLNHCKNILDVRNTLTHNACVCMHGLMNAGTTNDGWLRDNLEWLGKATNWAKFTATASLGVIHRGHTKESERILNPYLPRPGQQGSPFQEGGALFGLGLIHANMGTNIAPASSSSVAPQPEQKDKTQFLLESLRNAGQNRVVQHGACLGLGLTALSTRNQALWEELRGVLDQDDAVAGEAAALSVGLIFLGSLDHDLCQVLLGYAHDSMHEKIVRSCALALAFICYGREEEADTLIEQLSQEKEAILRYGACYALGLAYAATSNPNAIQRLLHVAVSDVNDDVRRAAVTCLGFVCADAPENLPKLVSLLSESYNPHVRYGSAMALGIGLAGTGNKEALEILLPLLRDRVDYVRQAAMIACAFLLIQHNEKQEEKFKVFQDAILDCLAAKGDAMTKVGALLALGIVNAGGRNVTISLLSPAGFKKGAAFIGVAVFTHFWYWYPLTHFLALAFTPTVVLGLNAKLEQPKQFSFLSQAPPSLFAYPKPMEEKKEASKKQVKHNTLSVTAKAKARAKKLNEERGIMEDEDSKEKEAKKAEETKDAKSTEEKKPEEIEPENETLSNPARVTYKQHLLLKTLPQSRYQPMKDTLYGIVMLKDTNPDAPEEIAQQEEIKVLPPGVSADEPMPPKPFEYSG